MNIIDAAKEIKKGAVMHSMSSEGYIRYKNREIDIGSLYKKLAGKECKPFVDYSACFGIRDILAKDWKKIKTPEHEEFWGYR